MRTAKQIEESTNRITAATAEIEAEQPAKSNGEHAPPDPSIAFLEAEIAECVQYRAEAKIQFAQLQQQANQISARLQQLDQKQAGYEAALAKLKAVKE